MKSQVLKKIEIIKKSHIKWYAYAEAIILNIETESDLFPKVYTDCEFGKWYYRDGQHLSFIETFVELEEIHIKLHTLYLSIYKQIRNTKQKSFLQFYKKKSNVELKQTVLQLKRLSEIIIEKMDDIKLYISKMDKKKFNSKYNSII